MSELLRIRTPGRLHLGLIGWGSPSRRSFGGIGLMVQDPRIELTLEPYNEWSATGPLADRALEIARDVHVCLDPTKQRWTCLKLTIEHAPAAHQGLGVGTQLSLAIARGLSILAGRPEISVTDLALIAGRGARSGIGIHGFAEGGLIADAGRPDSSRAPTRIARADFPADWRVLIVRPPGHVGIHGEQERHVFKRSPPPSEATSDKLSHLISFAMLPAAVEGDLDLFGWSVERVQEIVGGSFKSAQGGMYATAYSERCVAVMREHGLKGIGQSSWGPTLYGFSREDPATREALRKDIREALGLEPDRVYWTRADNQGASWLTEERSTPND